MKKIIILAISVCFSLISHAQVTKTLTINAGKLSSALTSTEKSTITNLTLTGTIDARDFKTMRDSMNVLAVLDISGATIDTYTGTQGTATTSSNEYQADSVPDLAFFNPGQIRLISVALPVSVTAIGENAFYNCTDLTSINIPSSVTSIGSYAFGNCTGLTSLNLPSSLTSILHGAFSGCSNVTSFKIPPLVTFIGAQSFAFCTKLTSITIPASVTSIELCAFQGISGLLTVDANNPNYSSVDGILFNKTKTTLIQLPVSKIGFYAIPSSVTLIGEQGLSLCIGLTSVTIPSSVTNIGSAVFSNCNGLTSITTKSVIPINLNSSPDVFYNVKKTTCILYVPQGTSGSYCAANQWKDFTNIVEMPGIKLSSVNEVIEAAQGSTGSIEISSDFTWTASSDRTWLTVTPTTGTGTKQTLAFTAQANPSTTVQRVAKITISAPDQLPQTFTVTQNVAIDPTKLDAFEPDNSLDKASIIKSGDIQQHSIYPFHDIDYASFDLTNAPALVEVKFNTISSGHKIQLLAADGNTVLSTDNTLINTTLTQNGKYYIKAWNPDSLLIPEYQLCLKIKPILLDKYEPDNTWAEAKLITPFTEQDDHTIKAIGDVDYVKFTISDAPCTIYADVTDNRKESKSFGVWLYDTNGTTILNYSNTPKINCGAYQKYTLTANGTYFLKVGLPQGESGSTRDDYTIKLTTNGIAPSITCNPADSLALVAIYNTMNGANWTRKLNWLTGKVQNWQGVTLSSEGRVTKLNLTTNNLKGTITPEIGQLTALRILNLGNSKYVEIGGEANSLMSSTLPLSMANLVNLEVLSLDAISFNSILTDVFSGMAKLRELYLNNDGFTNNQIPAGILSCSMLERLAIGDNFFSQLPDLTGLTNLQSFSAFYNWFTFEDFEPNWTISGINYSPQYRIGQSQALNPATGTSVTHTIEVGGAHNIYQWYKNDLPIPGQTTNTLRIENVSKSDAGIYQLRVTNTMATQLALYSNPLTLYQNDLPIYKALEAFYNSTGGANWTNNANWLSDAPISSWFGIDLDEHGKYSIGLAFNNLIGQLPESIGDLTFFTSISIYLNPQLTGPIPASIGNLNQLQNLNLMSNNLNGEIPSSIGNLKNLDEIFLGSNQLSGSVPATIVNCSNLRIAVLNDNNLENLPNLTALNKLVSMYLYNNQFGFDDLMPARLGNPNLYAYVPQKKFGKEEGYKKQLGEALTLTAMVGGTGNLYQWYKDGNPLNGKTTNTLVFNSLVITDQGAYTCNVTNPSVNGLTLESKTMSVIVNRVPVANAGTDQSIDELSVVTLDGSASSDPDGNPLTYKWSAPFGITLNSTTAAKPTFTAPEVTANIDFTISLVVNDGMVDSPADQVKITVKQVNKTPVANAGTDQSVNEGAIVTLDGSASKDADGNTLTYKWSVPLGITLNSTTAAKPTFTAPEVAVDKDYTLSLVVNDGMVDSPADQVKITVKQVNKVPVANAGTDQSVNEGVTVTLDGSASTDVDGNTLTYKWSAPAGITLSSTIAAKLTFTAPEVTIDKDYTFSLVVNDGMVDSPADQVKITVKQVNKVPVANAGTDQSVNEGVTVTLDGSASTDVDGNTLTYKWSAPAGITLSSTIAAKPTFTAPEVTIDKDYTISLVVNDGMVDSPADQVKITVKQVNKVPLANAGTDQSVNEGATVTLDGSASMDADGNTLSYKWIAPAEITLSSTTAAKPTFTAPEVTTDQVYIISLVVNNGTIDSPADEVAITVKNVDHAPYVKSAIQDVSVEKGAADRLIDLKTVFTDSDVNDVLSFAVTSNSNNQIVNTTISNSVLTLNFSTTNAGTADVVITATSNGKDVQSKFKVEVKLPTGIDELIDNEDVQIYPNPTNGMVHLKFNKTLNTDTRVTIFDLFGKMIFDSDTNKKEELINLSGNAPGIYIIQLDRNTAKNYKIILK